MEMSLSPTFSRIIPAQSGCAFRLKKGQLLKVITPTGRQVSDLFCFSADDPRESLSTARSMDYADSIYLSTGQDLYSNRSNIMLRIVEDTCGRHDLLMTPCSLKMFQLVSGTHEYHPSCHENLAQNLAEFGIGPDQIATTFNIFMNVEARADGRVSIRVPLSVAGDSITFHAAMDLIVGLTACSHEETNDGTCKPIEYEILSEN